MIIDELSKFVSLLKIGTRIIAIDYGSKKLGVAISDPNWQIAMPISIITDLSDKIKVTKLLEIFDSNNVCGIILGLPVNMDGSQSTQTIATKEFAERLEKRTKLPIFFQDERLTSKTADVMLKDFGFKKKDRDHKNDVIKNDAVAASLILETVLQKINKGNF